jgi:hypothetical protein
VENGKRLRNGYAYTSSRRYPRDPETIVLGDKEVRDARYVGVAKIDGCKVSAFRVKGERRFYFQLA